jgi:hypothetical protein
VNYYAASAPSDKPHDVNVRVSPDCTSFATESVADHKKFPAVEESLTLIWLIVSLPVIVQEGLVPVRAIAPEAAALNVACERVDTALV